MKKLDPKAIWLFFFNFLLVGIFLLFFLTAFMFSITGILLLRTGQFANFQLFGSYLIFILIVPFLAYLWAKLSYDRYKYELRDDGFRKEHGVIWKKYVTIPYERIQNVDIYRGLLARLLGLSDLQIQTAGMSAPYSGGILGGGVEGRLLGLSPQDAEKLRDELIKRARGKTTNQGL